MEEAAAGLWPQLQPNGCCDSSQPGMPAGTKRTPPPPIAISEDVTPGAPCVAQSAWAVCLCAVFRAWLPLALALASACASQKRFGPGADLLDELADQADGFSGRELAKLVTAVQAAVYGSPQRSLDAGMLRSVVGYKLKEHATRRTLLNKPAA